MPRAAILFFLAWVGLASCTGADDRPNIVVAIADDWSWPHAGALGDKVVKTPYFDRLAREGVLFERAYCASPSCTPSRGALLTGQAVHRLENGGNLWSLLPGKFACYPDLLEEAGYAVGLTGKGWGPGTLEGSGRSRNPAGPNVPDFARFLGKVPKGKPFCYWYGSTDPHRPYDRDTGAKSGMKPEAVAMPPYWPDTPEVRADMLDYYFEVERFDRAVGTILERLDREGLAENTIVVVTSDNGMPFPRCKANLYDAGTHMPLVIRWPAKVKGGKRFGGFVSLADLAPTFLEAAGVKPLPAMTGGSLLGALIAPASVDARQAPRDAVFLERERHANVRRGDLGYPSRAVRTARFLYIRNFRPDRWPAGDPEMWKSVGPFGDCDPSPTKDLILDRRDEPAFAPSFRLGFEQRPEEELYDLEHDPHEVKNVAGDERYAADRAALRARLERWMRDTADPRTDPSDDRFDRYPYGGPPAQ
ncbi:MAG: sulfatase [Isosphaeraceae bacterium]|nr:sulfatase [Isosphaeraceae bacterium]